MLTVGVFEAKARFSALLSEVENGAEVAITRHGRQIARIVPGATYDAARIKAAINGLQALSKTLELGDVDGLALRDEGRR